MYYNDHAPPHFHAYYAGSGAQIDISSGEIVNGHLSRRAQRLIDEWLSLHRGELMDNWSRARKRETLARIAPLD